MTTLAHISDIHLAPLPPVRLRELFSKRITGYLNWRGHRQSALSGEGLTNLVRHLREQAPDLVAVTGDLTNLGLDAEFNSTLNWLQTVGSPEGVMVTPGNHDAYVPGSVERAIKRWGVYAEGQTVGEKRFPFLRRVEDTVVIACSSAVPTLPFMSSGFFSPGQAERLATCLKEAGQAGLFRVVLIHHPPNIESSHPIYGLRGASRFREVVAEHGAELILHGHTHRSTIHAVHGPKGEVPVIGVAAAGAHHGANGEDPARYNLFRIVRLATGWSCTMREYGYTRIGSDIVMRLQMRIY